MTDPHDDLAQADRRRLDRLLRVGDDHSLHAGEPDRYPGPGLALWAAGFDDPDHGIRISVWFVRDPEERAEAAQSLAGPGAVVAMNGGMLFYGHVTDDCDAPESDPHARLGDLASQFAGQE